MYSDFQGYLCTQYLDSFGTGESSCKLRSKDLNDVKIDELGLAPAYPVPSLRFVFVSSNVG